MSIDVKYRTSATANGGRDGCTRSEDGKFDLQLSTPKELGWAGGEGTNPEQLFASGYAACFLGSLKFAAHELKFQVPTGAAVTATVGIGMRSEGGFGLDVELAVALPGVERGLQLAERLTCDRRASPTLVVRWVSEGDDDHDRQSRKRRRGSRS